MYYHSADEPYYFIMFRTNQNRNLEYGSSLEPAGSSGWCLTALLSIMRHALESVFMGRESFIKCHPFGFFYVLVIWALRRICASGSIFY